jgi:type II secretory pathway component GspD/PulD (secretin)/tetratricopeptide (TPR) repeat protein
LFHRLTPVVLLCACLSVAGWSASAALAQDQTALDLFNQAVSQYDAGQLQQAAATLQRVDEVQLPKEQRAKLQELRTSLAEKMSPAPLEVTAEPVMTDAAAAPAATEPAPPAPPTTAQLLTQADSALVAGDLSTAGSLYQQVAAAEDATADQRGQAQAAAAAVARRQDQDLTQARALLDAAARDIRSGDMNGAQAKLQQVQDSKVALGWFDQSRLDGQRAIVAKANAEKAAQLTAEQLAAEQAAAEKAAAEKVAADKAAAAEKAAVEQAAADKAAADKAAADKAAANKVAAQKAAADKAAADKAAANKAATEPVAVIPVVETPVAAPAPVVETPAVEAPVAAAVPAAEAPAAVEPAAPATPEAPAVDMLAMARNLRSQELVAAGRQAQDAGRVQTAIDSYREAVRLNPDNQEAAAALAAAQQQAAVAGAPREVLDEQIQANQLRAAAAQSEYDQFMNQAAQRLTAGNFAAAADLANQAKLVLDRNRGVLSTADYNLRRDKATALSAQVQQQQIQADRVEQDKLEVEREAQAQNRRRQARAEQEEQVQSLLQRALALQREQRYPEALTLVNQALALEPTNIAAQLMQESIEDAQVLVQYQKNERTFQLERAWQTTNNLEATIPYNQLLIYPKSWPKITATRLRDQNTGAEDSDVNRRVTLRLREPIPNVNFEANQLKNVLEFIQNVTGVNMVVNWPVLEAAGVEQDRPISLHLSNVPAEQVLRLVLRQAAADEFSQPEYAIIEGIVNISTQRDLTRTTDIRVYDIRDLLVQVPNFDQAPSFSLDEALQSHVEGGGGSSSSLFGDAQDQNQESGAARQALVDQITKLIEDTVGIAEDWQVNGGTVSSLRELNGNLIVKSTPQNHNQIVALLQQLRETRAIQIAVEARFLLVDQNFLDEFGIDLDLRINNIGGGFGPIQISQDSYSLVPVSQTGLPGSFGGTHAQASSPPYGFIPGQGSTQSGRSFEMGVSYLDDVEVNLLLNATQRSRKSISLTAPRVTFMNGQRAYVIVARQIAFISDLEPVPDAGGFDVTLSVVNSGVILDVEGTISADRRYVTLTLRPSLSTVTQPLRSVIVFGVTEGGTDVPGVVFNGFVEAPEVELTQVNTTVSVPDQGTLLLGGQRLVGETEIEAGVPVLSKIPIVNRFFTNTSTIKDERSLLILVRPTIIIQSEQEEELFPGLIRGPQEFNVGSSLGGAR